MSTRITLILLIFCMLLSNVVSAATMCCMVMQEPPVENAQVLQMDEMPCHKVSDQNEQNDADTQLEHPCKCQGCFQFSNILDRAFDSATGIATKPLFYHDNFHSLDLDSIYYPPRRIS